MKDIMSPECVQRRAANYSSNYKHRLVKLGMLPLMHEYADIVSFVKSLRFPNSSLDILEFDFVTFSTNHLHPNFTISFNILI